MFFLSCVCYAFVCVCLYVPYDAVETHDFKGYAKIECVVVKQELELTINLALYRFYGFYVTSTT